MGRFKRTVFLLGRFGVVVIALFLIAKLFRIDFFELVTITVAIFIGSVIAFVLVPGPIGNILSLPVLIFYWVAGEIRRPQAGTVEKERPVFGIPLWVIVGMLLFLAFAVGIYFSLTD